MTFTGNFSPTTIMIAVAIVVPTVYLLVFKGDDGEKRLRERLASIKEVKSNNPQLASTALMGENEKATALLKVALLLGYRPDLPPQYAVSLKFTLPIAGAIGMGAGKLLLSVIPIVPALAVGICISAGLLMFQFKRKNRAYRIALFRQIPDTLSLMLRAVRAGLPVAEAIKSISRESMSPTREEFTRVAAETALGMPIEVTLQRLFGRTRIQEYAFFAVVIGLHGQTGGNLSETLENLADTVRRRVAMAGKAKALAAEGRLSAMVVGGLPFVVGFLIFLMNPGYMQEFIENPSGKKLILAFAVLLTMGLFTTNVLVNRSTKD